MKRILFLLLAAIIASNVYCQINFGKLGTDVLVDNSIKNGISIIKSEYQLRNKKDGGLYGRGGKDIYGSVYNVGINLPTGVLVMADIKSPWMEDSDFDKYRNSGTYEPVLKSIKVFSKCDLDSVLCKELSLDTEIAYNNDSTLFLLKDLDLNNNFELKLETNIQDSWIIWFTVEKGQKLVGFENLEFYTLYQKQDQDIIGRDIKTPSGTNVLLGGIILTPKISGVGKIELKLVGLLNKDSNNWRIGSLPKEFLKDAKNLSSEHIPAPLVDNPIGDDEELTPIESKTKRKKKK